MLKKILIGLVLVLGGVLFPWVAKAEEPLKPPSRLEQCMKVPAEQLVKDGNRLMVIVGEPGFAWIKDGFDFLASRGEAGWCALQTLRIYILSLPREGVDEEVVLFRVRTVARLTWLENAHSI